MGRWVRAGMALVVVLSLAASPGVAIGAATTSATSRHKRACLKALRRAFSRKPRQLKGAPPAALTSILGVLRKPPARGDMPPRGAIADLGPFFYSAFWLRSARLLHTETDGTRYFMIPGDYSPPAFPKTCVSLLPPSERKPPPQRPGGATVTLEAFSKTQSGGLPYTPTMITVGDAFEFDSPSSGTTVRLYGVVPDGVASVTVSLGSNPSTTSPVADNFFITRIPAPPANQRFTITQQWYAPNGTLIKTTSHTFTIGTFTGNFFGK